jgi:hypothetical protein
MDFSMALPENDYAKRSVERENDYAKRSVELYQIKTVLISDFSI